MTDFIVKCADVSWQRHSVSIHVGNFRTKRQIEDGMWPESQDLAVSDGDEDLEDGDGAGSSGLWITDDYLEDHIPLWRPPYTVDIKRVALQVTCPIDVNTGYYYKFELLNSSDSTPMAYFYTYTTGLDEWTPVEMTVHTSNCTLERTEGAILRITDEWAVAPIRGLTVTIDYEPSA